MNQSSSLKRFHHGFYEVHLPVTDVDRATDFYVTKLGLVAELGDLPRPDSSYRPLSEWRTFVGKVVDLPEIATPTP